MSTNPSSWFHKTLLRLAGQVRLESKTSSPANEAGLTLIECLAAIVVVGLVGAAIAPVLVLSVATRVQSQKAEQALNLAQSEIDALKVILERGGEEYLTAAFPPVASDIAEADPMTAGKGADGIYSGTDPFPTDYTEARPIDIDGDDEPDFAIQSYRAHVLTSSDGLPLAFNLGVRVYDYRTVENATGELETEQASIGLTASEGERSQQPLAALYTSLAVSDDEQSYCNYLGYFGATKEETPLGCN